MSRKKARESVILLLYHWDMMGCNSDNIAITLDETVVGEIIDGDTLNEDDTLYLNSIIEGIKENVESIDQAIEAEAVGWKINRLPKVDLAVLRLGVYELMHREDIPGAVTINECVEFAKHYSTENSGTFVNGVLSTVMKKKNADGQ
jgi:transcription antitermination protein NusB